jgi:type VI secretion system protein ImpC
MADPKAQQEAPSVIGAVEVSDFDSLLRKEFKPKTDEAKEAVERAVRTLAEQALSQTRLISADVVKSIEAIIAQLDRKLTEQINVILHHEDFQKLEGAWRGLHHLVSNTETDEMLKIRFMNISKADLGKTLKRYKGTAWDQSPLFKKIYEAEYGQFGGEPFGCLTWSCWARWRRSRPPRTRRSSPARRRRSCRCRPGRNWPTRGT